MSPKALEFEIFGLLVDVQPNEDQNRLNYGLCGAYLGLNLAGGCMAGGSLGLYKLGPVLLPTSFEELRGTFRNSGALL